MITLGVYAARGGCAVAIADRGRVLGAVNASREQSDVEQSELSLACVEQALRLSSLSPADLNAIVAVETAPNQPAPFTAVPTTRRFRALASALSATHLTALDPLLAQATLSRAVAPANAVVLILDGHRPGHAAVVSIDGRAVACVKPLTGWHDVIQLAARMADALGEDPEQPLLSLEKLAGSRSEGIETRLARSLDCRRDLTFSADVRVVEQVIEEEQAGCPAPLDSATAVHVAVQRTRGALAAAMLEQIAEVIARVAESARSDAGVPHIVFGGSAFASSELAARVTRRLATAVFAPVAGPIGSALGAALFQHDDVPALTHLAFGPAFSEHDIKSTLENCRLDYVYEPDWSKLYRRVSELLTTGALVGWFQGSLEIGPHSFGSRSILCDPSNRYARENLNVYLLQRDAHTTLPLSLAESAWDQSADATSPLRLELATADRLRPWRDQIISAVNNRGECLLHVAGRNTPQELRQLLEVHRARTGVPGLINVPMTRSGELTVTPRDAVRVAFGSAVDALVMSRFLVSKDYWLLRSRQP